MPTTKPFPLRRPRDPLVAVRKEPRYDILCGCGWGRLACPESLIPDACPLCGYVFAPTCVED